jgi:hypothetical protein
MARHINKRHQEFIKHIQQRIASRYNHNSSSNTPTFDTDQKTPIAPEVIRHRIYTRLNKNKPADIPAPTPAVEPALDAFEREYQEFIAKLKAQKEQKLKEIEQVDVVEEPAPKKKRTRKKKIDDSTEEIKTKKRRTRKTKEKVEE